VSLIYIVDILQSPLLEVITSLPPLASKFSVWVEKRIGTGHGIRCSISLQLLSPRIAKATKKNKNVFFMAKIA